MRTFHRTWRTLGAIVLALGLCAVLAPGSASAHERRALADGKYQAVVGFLNEPAQSRLPFILAGDVLADPPADVGRLADVEDVALGVLQQVDAGARGQAGEHLPVELGLAGAALDFPAPRQ